MGDFLIASVARDAFVLKTKGGKPVHSEQERLRHLLHIGLVDEASLSDTVPGTYSIVLRSKPDIVCFGHDQVALRENLTSWLRNQDLHLQTCTLKAYRPEKYKSSKLNRKEKGAVRSE